LKKHLPLIKILIPVFTAAAIIYGCGKKQEPAPFIARVNDAHLTSEQFSSLADTNKNVLLFEDEIIRRWIDRELLYQQAVKQGITEEEEFQNILKETEKQAAVSLFIKNFFDQNPPVFDQKEFEEFYNNNSGEFLLPYQSYAVNYIKFSNDDKASLFRNSAVELGWSRAYNIFKGDPSIVEEENNRFYYEHEIAPLSMLRMVKELNPLEISIILQDYEENFFLVQVLDKYSEGTIPPLEVIKEHVAQRYIAAKSEKLLRDYIKNLYHKNEIEVKRN
jgi:hypothetical protein